ncbi:MAG: threonine--tRNA ligase, partial [Clostridia bacterium]|nr:threonine--tRNA ligase [Clostridia bacterium]
VEVDLRNEKIGYKIREAQLEKQPYMLVIGDKEAEAGAVAVRARKGVDLGAMPVADFIAKVNDDVVNKTLNY